MKFNTERTTKYSNIPRSVKVFMKVLWYPHHQFAILANHPIVSYFPISTIWNRVKCPYSDCPIFGSKMSSVGEEDDRTDGVRMIVKWRKERLTSNCIPYTHGIIKRSRKNLLSVQLKAHRFYTALMPGNWSTDDSITLSIPDEYCVIFGSRDDA